MRTLILGLALLATGCAKTGCSACSDPDDEAVCRDQVQICNLLGPATLLLGKGCKEEAYAICETVDTGDTDVL
jgi:hypothetical protein